MKKHKYRFIVINGRVKIYIDEYVFLSFDQLNFEAYYAAKEDSSLYSITFYLKDTTVETTYKTKEVWLDILKLLDKHL